jgi:L-lactate dehydrogenase complex protein LldG
MPGTTERFLSELARVGGVGQAADSVEEVTKYLLSALREKRTRSVVLDASLLPERLDVNSLRDQLTKAGINVLDDERPSALREADVGITGVIAAVAESGSLLLGGPPKAAWQWASLLPPLHIALVEAERICPSLDEAFQALKDARTRGLEEFVWITGPSRTADIAITLLLGMHGPKELHAVIVR